MQVLKATEDQYESINGYKNGDSIILFSKDANEEWVVGEAVIPDPAFAKIKAELEELEKIEYVRKE